MLAEDRAASLLRLTRRKASAARPAEDHDLRSRLRWIGRDPHEIGRALVAETWRYGIMDLKIATIGEYLFKLALRLRPFQAAMRHARKIGGGEVDAAVAGVGRGRNGRSIGGPHCRGAGRGQQEVRFVRPCRRADVV